MKYKHTISKNQAREAFHILSRLNPGRLASSTMIDSNTFAPCFVGAMRIAEAIKRKKIEGRVEPDRLGQYVHGGPFLSNTLTRIGGSLMDENDCYGNGSNEPEVQAKRWEHMKRVLAKIACA